MKDPVWICMEEIFCGLIFVFLEIYVFSLEFFVYNNVYRIVGLHFAGLG